MNEAALSTVTSFVIDGSVTRELFGEVHRAVRGENGRCMQLAQGRV